MLKKFPNFFVIPIIHTYTHTHATLGHIKIFTNKIIFIIKIVQISRKYCYNICKKCFLILSSVIKNIMNHKCFIEKLRIQI